MSGKRNKNNSGRRVAWWQSIQVRFLLSYLFIIAAVLVVLNTYPILTMQNSIFRMKQTSVQNQASVVSSALSSLGSLSGDEVELDSISSRIQNGLGFTVSRENSNAMAVMARSPPESKVSTCSFFPGGWATISMPVSR